MTHKLAENMQKKRHKDAPESRHISWARHQRMITIKQRNFLVSLIDTLSFQEASELIDKLKSRKSFGITPKQRVFLENRGFDTKGMTKQDASRIIEDIKLQQVNTSSKPIEDDLHLSTYEEYKGSKQARVQAVLDDLRGKSNVR